MSELKRVRFDCNGNNAPAYGCNLPGDNSGEYVPFEVAQGLYEALEILIDQLPEFAVNTFDIMGEYSPLIAAEKALKKARGE